MTDQPSEPYGKELILDLHDCDPSTFNRGSIEKFFEEICELIDMERCKLSWWDDHGVPPEEQQTEPHLKGTTAVQFILTSNIVIHTLDLLGAVYINVFSCKEFDAEDAKQFSEKWFKGRTVSSHVIKRI
tara:strand:- start:3446 stop:3832 length:387 start_codon:yes stop_codon:yes gene_type:complete